MINKPGEEINNLTPAPVMVSTDNNNLENNNFEVYWFYFDLDEKFLLRIGEVKIKEKYQIRFEILNTEELSEEKVIYAESFERDELIEYLELRDQKNLDKKTYLDDKNLDPKTYLARCTNFIVQKCDSDECLIQVKTDNNQNFRCSLRKSKNKDKKFFNMSAYNKVLQMEKKVQTLIATLIEKNDNLKEENKKLKEELEKIQKSNVSLSEENETISKDIKKAKKIQEKAIAQLKELTTEEN